MNEKSRRQQQIDDLARRPVKKENRLTVQDNKQDRVETGDNVVTLHPGATLADAEEAIRLHMMARSLGFSVQQSQPERLLTICGQALQYAEVKDKLQPEQQRPGQANHRERILRNVLDTLKVLGAQRRGEL